MSKRAQVYGSSLFIFKSLWLRNSVKKTLHALILNSKQTVDEIITQFILIVLELSGSMNRS